MAHADYANKFNEKGQLNQYWVCWMLLGLKVDPIICYTKSYMTGR